MIASNRSVLYSSKLVQLVALLGETQLATPNMSTPLRAPSVELAG